MSAWPPPADETTTVWVTIRPRRGTPVRVRWTDLWGRRVLVNVEGRLFCDGCGEFVDAAELLKVDNSHRPTLPRPGAVLLPMAPDREPAPREPSVRDVQW